MRAIIAIAIAVAVLVGVLMYAHGSNDPQGYQANAISNYNAYCLQQLTSGCQLIK